MRAWWRAARDRHTDHEIDAELASYVEERTAQGIADGLDPDEASRRARVEVGGVNAMAVKLREQRAEAAPWRWLRDLARDLRHAIRQMRRAPAVPLAAVLTLALGIGGAAAMFALVHGVLLTPPPYADPSRLVLLSPARLDGAPYDRRPSTAQWLAWRDAARGVDLALYRWTFNFLVQDGGSKAVGGMIVTPEYFEVLGLKPLRGRTFLDDEAASAGPPAAIILGYELWQRSFGGDPDIVGKHVTISRVPTPLPIVGVMPPGVRFLPDPGAASEPGYDMHATVDFWVSALADQSALDARAWNVVGRLAPNVSVATIAAAVAGATARLRATDPSGEPLTATARPLLEVVNEDGQRLLMPLSAAVVLVLVIACANVAGLLLARGLHRQREYVLQAALGASWQRLFRRALTESLVLSLAGALAGAGAVAGLVSLFLKVGGHALPHADGVSVGWPVLAFCFVAAPIVAAAAGVVPAVRAAVNARASGFESTRSTATPAQRRLLGGVAAFQIVLTVALLAGAALLVRTARGLANVRPGYDTTQVLTMSVATLRGDTWQRIHTEALERVSNLPGVRSAAFAWGLPLTGNHSPATLAVVGRGEDGRLGDQIRVSLRAVTPDYFSAMGIGVSEGRVFRDADTEGTPPVAIVNRSFAERHFAGAQALGRALRHVDGNDRRTFEIVGIVSDTRTLALSEPAAPEVYLPLWQNRAIWKHLVVRTEGEPMAAASLVRATIHAVDPTAAVEDVRTMSDVREASIAPRVFAMHLLVGFAVVATVLALVGLYGVLSLSIAARVKEMAVRKAIGAQPSQVLSLVLTEGGRLIASGVALGLALALAVGRLLRGLLFGVEPTDPVTLVGAAAAFAFLAMATCAVPAWRAAREDLMDALRRE